MRGVTHRQRVGLVVIGAALVLVAVVAGQQPHLVAGAGQAAPVPGPPAVGDCVVDSPPGSLLESASVAATSGGTVPTYPAQQTRPCTGVRYGEISFVITAPQPSVVQGDDANGRSLDDPNLKSCVSGAMRYLGMATTQPIQRFWYPYLQTGIGMSSPSPRQKAAGQHWAACIVTLRPADSTSADPDSNPPRYDSSILDALHTGGQRDQLSNCSATAIWNSDPNVGCGQPHALEFLAFGDIGDHPVTRGELEVTCQQVVRQLTAMPDPTAGGALSVQVHIEDNTNTTVVTTAQIPPHSNLTCGVVTTGSRKLGGSLLALGRQPIPWA